MASTQTPPKSTAQMQNRTQEANSHGKSEASTQHHIPAHLRRYVVDQDYSRYTPIDQEVWRYIMRQLKDYLSRFAHPCYLQGLEKTGISTEHIPDIQVMNEKLQKFGWQALPVSGFIPPAAFMELQSLGFLPIASDMRTIDHLMYTPAPDIVHEAAGHAPILVDPDFAAYLKDYASVARKAIISREDMQQYEAIRVLSDLKEDPSSTAEQIHAAEQHLSEVSRSIQNLSEAAYLGRMNWWTAEYGLIGSIDDPRIFGAGLLSSYGEAKSCLSPKVKKIPLTIDCLNYAYDITEPQPQLFVTPDFKRLRDILEEMAAKMAFRKGGIEGLEKIRVAETVNTIELNSGLQISGILKHYVSENLSNSTHPIYVQFAGPTQLSFAGTQLEGHGKDYHEHGYGAPIGLVKGATKCLSEMTGAELESLGLKAGSETTLTFQSGIEVKGTIRNFAHSTSGKLLLIAFLNCRVKRGDQVFFEPEWGVFDMACGSSIPSVYGGPADRSAYGETEDFVAKVIPRKNWPELVQYHHRIYQAVRDLRKGITGGSIAKDERASEQCEKILTQLESDFPHDWLLRLGLYELSKILPSDRWQSRVQLELQNLADSDPQLKIQIEDGLRLLK